MESHSQTYCSINQKLCPGRLYVQTSPTASITALGLRLTDYVNMKSNYELLLSSVIYGLAGLGLIFLPAEIAPAVGQDVTGFLVWALQSLGAAYLGVAWINFMSKHAPLGGINGRPVLMLNVMLASPSLFFSFDLMNKYPDQPAFLGLTVVFGLLTAAFLRRLLGKSPVAPPATA